jgi:uncharacterized membrane protein YbhN (UPF0104 family)
MKSSKLSTIILSSITFILIAAFVYYLYFNADKYVKLFHLSTTGVLVIFLLSLVFPLLSGSMTTFLFRGIGVNLSFRDGFLLNAASTLANQLPISGGIISRGFYLKRKYDLSYSKFLSATVALFLCFIGTNGLIGLVILLYGMLIKRAVVSAALLIGFAVMAACLLIFWLPIDRIKFPNRIGKLLHQAVEGWTLISRNPGLLRNLIGLQLSLLISLAIRYWMAFHMLSQNVTLSDAMLFSTATILTQLVSIAPGGIGVREAIVGTLSSALGFDTGASVVAVGLDRLISTVPILLIGGVSALILGKQISDVSLKMEGYE